MARKASSIGPFALGIIEDAKIDLLSDLLVLRENDTEPDFGLPDEIPASGNFDAAADFRKKLIDALSLFD
ncbi:MAG: hypothetical protein IT488_10820, partial [Gammaproteobacteria bacterium]|nr:hypothetical protein [Gammaproteobacteria bacterium]